MTTRSILLACLAVLAATGQARPSPAARPSPKPAPPPIIEGTVKGPDGKPVEGALVLAGEVAGSVRAVSDGGGRYRLPLADRHRAGLRTSSKDERSGRYH
jgi:hypothetical protein